MGVLAYILVLQPVRIPSYILVFFAGAWAWKCRWLEPGGYAPSPLAWGVAFLLLGIPYLWQKIRLPAWGLEPALLAWANALCQAAWMWASVFFLLGAARRFLDRTGPVLRALSSTSYAVYYLHMPVLFCVAWAFVGIPLNACAKYLCVCAISICLCFLLGRQLRRHVPAFSG